LRLKTKALGSRVCESFRMGHFLDFQVLSFTLKLPPGFA
jgi:hypothetical protein